jgi:quercetin dioxygenase-like cupin family protein
MTDTILEAPRTDDGLLERFIPFSSLRYSTDAFIDYRIPGCGPKKNYALIGPGVSQNPNQPVSLREKHGFQVGGVSMPHGVTNPPHMHFTAEVFICTQGTWQFHWGFNPHISKAEFGAGDICTVPTWIYRGFKNIGTDEAFMFTALGGDDTGGILWGPQTLEAAREQGVHLTADYQIIDEQLGQKWEPGMQRLEPMTPAEVDALRTWTPEQMARRIVRHADLQWSKGALLDAALPGCGAEIAPVIGLGMSEDRNHVAPVNNAHGFSIEWLRIPAGGSMSAHTLASKQVLAIYRGSVEISVSDKPFAQSKRAQAATKIIASGSYDGWDSYAMPADVWRSYRNAGSSAATMLVMTPGDARKRITWAPEVVQASAASGFAIDANGYVALKKFTDRSQR